MKNVITKINNDVNTGLSSDLIFLKKNNKAVKLTSSIPVENDNSISFVDGTLVCYGSVSVGTVNANSNKQLYIDLPKTYKSTDIVVQATIKSTGSYWSNVQIRAIATSTSKILIELYNNGSNNAVINSISYLVIGIA